MDNCYRYRRAAGLCVRCGDNALVRDGKVLCCCKTCLRKEAEKRKCSRTRKALDSRPVEPQEEGK